MNLAALHSTEAILMSSDERLDTMAIIMEQKDRDIETQELQPLDPEGVAMADGKRESFDLPINVVKTDPLR